MILGSTARHDELAVIVEYPDDAFIGLTLGGVVTSWNAAAEHIYGYSAVEMIGQETTRIVPEELRAAERKLIGSVGGGMRIESVSTGRVRRDGGRLIVSRLADGVAQEFNNINTAILGLVECIVDHQLEQHELELRLVRDHPTSVVTEIETQASPLAGERSQQRFHRTIADATYGATPAGAPHGAYVQIIVRGSGQGARGTDRVLSLEPVHANATSSGDAGSAGLAMANGVVRQLGGFVTITSVQPSGSDVSVFLPMVEANAPTVDARRDEKEALGGSETILVVDDEEPVRKVISRGLRSRGYHVIEAQNGEDALVVAGAYDAPIHLVVSDVVMPQMDGRALFERLRTWYPNIRFLFVSGYTRGVITGDELEGSMTAFLAKPFGLEQLCEQVRVLLDQPRQPAEGGFP